MNRKKQRNARPAASWIHKLVSNNKIKYGALSIVMITIAFVLFLGLNFVFKVLDVQIGLQTDMTTQKMYSLSNEARNFLEELSQDVTITVVQEESKFDTKTIEALKNFDLTSDRITYQYINLDLNPAFAELFRNEAIKDSSIIIQCGTRYQILDEKELYYLSDNGNVIGLRMDQKLCSAIAFVSSEERLSIGIISGHGASLPDEFRELCSVINRDVMDLTLILEDIPENTDILVLYEPTADFVPEEIKKMDDWLLEGNNNLVVIMDANVGKLNVLESYLAEWGLEPQNNIVVDAQRYWGGNEVYLLAEYAQSTEVGKSALESKLSLTMPLCRSIKLNNKNNSLSSCEQFQIVKSFDTSYIKTLENGYNSSINVLEQTGEDETGSFILGAGSTKLLANVRGQEVSSTVFVYGSALMTNDSMMNSPALGNRTVIMDSLLYNKQKTETINIPIVALKNYSLDITSGEARVIRMFTMYVIPIGLCLFGGIVWIRRKKR